MVVFLLESCLLARIAQTPKQGAVGWLWGGEHPMLGLPAAPGGCLVGTMNPPAAHLGARAGAQGYTLHCRTAQQRWGLAPPLQNRYFKNLCFCRSVLACREWLYADGLNFLELWEGAALFYEMWPEINTSRSRTNDAFCVLCH